MLVGWLFNLALNEVGGGETKVTSYIYIYIYSQECFKGHTFGVTSRLEDSIVGKGDQLLSNGYYFYVIDKAQVKWWGREKTYPIPTLYPLFPGVIVVVVLERKKNKGSNIYI